MENSAKPDQEQFDLSRHHLLRHNCFQNKKYGPSCSKLTMSLVNDSLKFPSSDTQIC